MPQAQKSVYYSELVETPLAEQVRAVVERLLDAGMGRPSCAAIGKRLCPSLTRRTLQRRLAIAGIQLTPFITAIRLERVDAARRAGATLRDALAAGAYQCEANYYRSRSRMRARAALPDSAG